MKKISSSVIIILILLQGLSGIAQPSGENTAEDSSEGIIVLTDQSTVTGTVKDNIRKKGEVILVSAGKKTKYKASEISELQIGTRHYLTNNYTFYEILWEGKNNRVLRKANDPSGVVYNGTEPVLVSSEGRIDDYFIQQKSINSLHWLTKKNFNTVLLKLCPKQESKLEQLEFTVIQKVLEGCEKQE